MNNDDDNVGDSVANGLSTRFCSILQPKLLVFFPLSLCRNKTKTQTQAICEDIASFRLLLLLTWLICSDMKALMGDPAFFQFYLFVLQSKYSLSFNLLKLYYVATVIIMITMINYWREKKHPCLSCLNHAKPFLHENSTWSGVRNRLPLLLPCHFLRAVSFSVQ